MMDKRVLTAVGVMAVIAAAVLGFYSWRHFSFIKPADMPTPVPSTQQESIDTDIKSLDATLKDPGTAFDGSGLSDTSLGI